MRGGRSRARRIVAQVPDGEAKSLASDEASFEGCAEFEEEAPRTRDSDSLLDDVPGISRGV